mmetsp:Transcript_1506/g.3029  ORF Transcript_1506/g.3029 Transcript_1506/m.3029 type:complete len:296 (+) Transcript_1506:141-1028(+)
MRGLTQAPATRCQRSERTRTRCWLSLACGPSAGRGRHLEYMPGGSQSRGAAQDDLHEVEHSKPDAGAGDAGERADHGPSKEAPDPRLPVDLPADGTHYPDSTRWLILLEYKDSIGLHVLEVVLPRLHVMDAGHGPCHNQVDGVGDEAQCHPSCDTREDSLVDHRHPHDLHPAHALLIELVDSHPERPVRDVLEEHNNPNGHQPLRRTGTEEDAVQGLPPAVTDLCLDQFDHHAGWHAIHREDDVAHRPRNHAGQQVLVGDEGEAHDLVLDPVAQADEDGDRGAEHNHGGDQPVVQ